MTLEPRDVYFDDLEPGQEIRTAGYLETTTSFIPTQSPLQRDRMGGGLLTGC
jgi:hypothetical protein